mmetsp:Transcript_39944/g.98909  ORF Transcript_39944/g.98909 Transcript_39944/m.98909 type:complete len:81 (+) Transcript_39944:526-768(+)
MPVLSRLAPHMEWSIYVISFVLLHGRRVFAHELLAVWARKGACEPWIDAFNVVDVLTRKHTHTISVLATFRLLRKFAETN